MNQNANPNFKEDKGNSVKEYFAFGEVLGYFFRKKDPNNRPNFNLRMMHGINKISIIVFLLELPFSFLNGLSFSVEHRVLPCLLSG